MPHVRFRWSVFIQTFRNGSLRTSTVWIRTVCFECPRLRDAQCCWRMIGSLSTLTIIIGFGFAATRSSSPIFLPASSTSTWCSVFWMANRKDARAHRKTHDVEQTEKMISFTHHTGKCLTSTCLRVGVSVSPYLIWILGSTLILSNHQSSATVGSGHVSPRRTSDFKKHLDHRFIVFNGYAKAPTWEGFAFVLTWSTLNISTSSRLTCFFVLVLACFAWGSSRHGSPRTGRLSEEWSTSTIPRDRERWYRPCEDQRPKNLEIPQQSLSLGRIDNDVPYYPHGNVVCDHSCDECKEWDEPNVCHQLWFILWQLVPTCTQTKECQVFQFVPHVSSSSFLNWWSSKHGVDTIFHKMITTTNRN